MRELIRDRTIAIDAERALNITESYAKNLLSPPEIKRAQATYDVCSRMTCRVEEFGLVVGNFGTSFLGCGVWPEEGRAVGTRSGWGLSPRGHGHQAVRDRGGEG